MVKFSKHNRINPIASLRTGALALVTHEGGRGQTLDLESELFLMAATYLAGED